MIGPGHAIVTCGVERHLPPEGAPVPHHPGGHRWGLGANLTENRDRCLRLVSRSACGNAGAHLVPT